MFNAKTKKTIFGIFLILYWFVFIQIPVNAACGSFTENTVLSSLSSPYGVTAGDYDGDGDIDIAVTLQGSSSIVWYKNNGSQVFTAQTAIKTGYSTPQLLLTYDVDQDGDLDLVSIQDPTSTGDNDDVIVYINNGTGTSWTQYTVVGTVNGGKQIDVGDIDKDGDIDVVVADSNDNNVMWYKNNGSEVFTEYTVVGTLDGVIGTNLGDINNDGEMDIVVSSQGSSQDIIWYENDGSENFSSNAHTIDSAYYGQYNELVDLDGDGDLDLIVASYVDDLLSWYRNNGNETFTNMGNIDSGATDLNAANNPHAADLDNDGDIDIVVSAWDANKFIWYSNDGSENFTQHILKTSTDARESYIIDVDSDGYTDILHADLAGGKIYWWQSDCTDPAPAFIFPMY